jgi:hypothetical protein
MKRIVIDDYIITFINDDEIKIRTIKTEKIINPNLNIEALKKITYGSKEKDKHIISLLYDGLLNSQKFKSSLTIE